MTSVETKTALKQPSKKAVKLHEQGVRRIRTLDRISVAVLTAITIGFALQLPKSAAGGADEITQVVFLIALTIIIQGAVMIRQSVARITAGRDEDVIPGDSFFKGWFFTFFTPLISLLVLLPSISMGVFNDDDFGPVAAAFLLLILLYMALLLSALVAAFVLAPIELLIRGIIAAAKGDKKRIGYIYSGLFIGLITTFTLIAASAFDTDSMGAALPALLGLPGSYTVENDALAWTARVLGLVILFGFINIAGAKRKAEIKK